MYLLDEAYFASGALAYRFSDRMALGFSADRFDYGPAILLTDTGRIGKK